MKPQSAAKTPTTAASAGDAETAPTMEEKVDTQSKVVEMIEKHFKTMESNERALKARKAMQSNGKQ